MSFSRTPIYRFAAFLLLTILIVNVSPAASVQAQQTDGLQACAAGPIDLNPSPGACSDLQVILLVDNSASMDATATPNDPGGLRFEGVRTAMNILAQRYLIAAEDPAAPLPDLKIAAIHFGTIVPPQFPVEWVDIAPTDAGSWAPPDGVRQPGVVYESDLVYARLVPDGIRTYIRNNLPGTNFIDPFQKAAELAATLPAPDSTGCPNRVILVLTDGAPARGLSPLTGQALANHMESVREIVASSFSGPGDEVYVTGISSGEDYWRDSRAYWEQITGSAETGEVPRTDRVSDAAALAARISAIVATKVGLQNRLTNAGTVFIPPFLESVQINYFAPVPDSVLQVFYEGENGNQREVVPDGEQVVLTGEDSVAKTMTIQHPEPGTYNLSVEGGSINLIFTYSDQELSVQNDTPLLQQFTAGSLRFTLPESSPYGPRYQMTLAAPGQADQTFDLPGSGPEYAVDLLPPGSGAGSADIQAIGTNIDGEDCLLGEAGFTFEVAPVEVTAVPPENDVCTPSEMPLTFSLRLTNTRTGEPTAISLPLEWTVTALHSDGAPVDASVEPTGEPGGYLFALDTTAGGAVEADVQAAVQAGDQSLPLFARTFTFDSLIQDQRYGFELTGVYDPADERTIWINRLLNRLPAGDDSLLVVGRSGTGGDEISITGRYFDLATGEQLPGINRFALSIYDTSGRRVAGPTTAWYLAEDGRQTIDLPAPALGDYVIVVSDEGAVQRCVLVYPPAETPFTVLGLQWGTTVLFVLLTILLLTTAVLWIRWIICTRAGPLSVHLKEDHQLRIAPHGEDGLDLATLTSLPRLVVQEKVRPAVGKLEDKKGWLHVFVQVEGYVEKPGVCCDRERPMVKVPGGGRIPVYKDAEKDADVLLWVNRSTYVEVLEELERWYRVRVTLSGYIDASVAAQAEGSFRTCFRRALTVKLAHQGRLQSTPLETHAREVVRLRQPAELLVLEDETAALQKVATGAGWLSVQTRLTGYVPRSSLDEGPATVIRKQEDSPVKVFEFAGQDGDLLADIFETVPARVIQAEGDWARVEILALGYVRAENTGRPSRPFGSERPDRPEIQDTRVQVPECKQEKDDLKIIEGIGPQVERLLNAHGIWTFEDLAAYRGRTSIIEAWLDEKDWEMMTPDTWPRQASLAASGDMAGLARLVDRLTAGRPEQD